MRLWLYLMRYRYAALLSVISLAFNALAQAAPPVLDYLFPAGGQRGTSVAVTAAGTFDSWPVQGWVDSTAIHVKAAKEKGALTIQIDPTATVGPHLLRLYTEDGASALRCFVIGDSLEALEIEPNDELRAAQTISKLPVTINGQLDKSGDVDCYALKLEKGTCLVASLQGRRLGSSMDPMLHLLGPDGIECAFAHDGLGLDPLLSYRVEKPGRYVVRVSAFSFPPAADVKLAGGKGDLYRLHLTTGPVARFCLPSGISRKEKSQLHLQGWNFPPTGASSEVTFDPNSITGLETFINIPTPGGDGWLRAEVGDGPEWLDQEARKEGVVLPVPINITGRIQSPGEVHRFKMTLKKDEQVRFIVRTGILNSPLDALLHVENRDGKVVATANAGGISQDVIQDWTAGVDGDFYLTLSDLFGKGASDAMYRLEIKHPSPTVTATIDTHAIRLVPGKSATVKLNVSRKDGHSAGLIAVATGLPKGVTATSAEVPPKGGEIAIALTAAADATPANDVVHFMILGTDAKHPEVHTVPYLLRQEKDVIQEWVDQSDAAWLTVVPIPPATKPSTMPTTKPATNPK